MADDREIAGTLGAKIKEGFDPIEDRKAKLAVSEIEKAEEEAYRQRKITFSQATDR